MVSVHPFFRYPWVIREVFPPRLPPVGSRLFRVICRPGFLSLSARPCTSTVQALYNNSSHTRRDNHVVSTHCRLKLNRCVQLVRLLLQKIQTKIQSANSIRFSTAFYGTYARRGRRRPRNNVIKIASPRAPYSRPNSSLCNTSCLSVIFSPACAVRPVVTREIE